MRLAPTSAGRRIEIDLGPLCAGLRAGDSVAVNGACLTATTLAAPVVAFDVVSETLARTTLGALATGARVNLERAVLAADALDGHIVQGHVDGVAGVRRIDRGGQWLVEFAGPPELTETMVPKGSVAIDGVSLTLVDVGSGTFSVALIPTTLRDTTLEHLAIGSKVNIETDVIGKYVRKILEGMGATTRGGLSMDALRRNGFA